MNIQEKAFPNPHLTHETGMTMRDYFAARATEQDIKHYERSEDGEMVGTDTYGTEWRRPRIVYHTREQAKYRYADAMMEARK
jgi:hypothetical protein